MACVGGDVKVLGGENRRDTAPLVLAKAGTQQLNFA